MYTDATVGFVMPMISAMEGQLDNVQVCLQISDIPSGGLSCPVNVSLSLVEPIDLKEGRYCNVEYVLTHGHACMHDLILN